MDQLNITDLDIRDLKTQLLTVHELTVEQLSLHLGPWVLLCMCLALLSLVALSVSTVRYHARERRSLSKYQPLSADK